jgi:D-aminopeptidase
LGENSSGDIFLCWSTANRGRYHSSAVYTPLDVQMLHHDALTPLFEAAADATEEAIVNALCMATTTTGADGRTAHALPLDRLQALMQRSRFC